MVVYARSGQRRAPAPGQAIGGPTALLCEAGGAAGSEAPGMKTTVAQACRLQPPPAEAEAAPAGRK